MTLTMIDIEATESLDFDPACEWDHQGEPPPATHSCQIIACGCVTLYCRACTDELLKQWHQMLSEPMCDRCGRESPPGTYGQLIILRPLPRGNR